MDETQPLLQDGRLTAPELEQTAAAAEDGRKNLTIVSFDPDGDIENPQEWSKAFRWSIVGLLASMAFTVTFTCIGVVPIANRIAYDLDNNNNNNNHVSKSASVLLVTIWELGEAIGPFLIAPLSEMYGRYPVFNAANMLFIAATVLAALSQSTSLFIFARALTGFAVASNVLNPAIVGDVLPPEERGTAMSLIQLAPLTGGAVGPAIAGAIVESSGWRNVLWMSVALAGGCELAFLVWFPETYKVAILRRKAARVRAETGDESVTTAFDAEDGDGEQDATQKFWGSIMRPTAVFLDSGVLQGCSLFASVAFAYFYNMSTTLPDILEEVYGLTPALTGTAFMTFSAGSAVACVGCHFWLDRIYITLRDSEANDKKGVGRPEYRLPLVVVGALTMPITVMLYGWSAQVHWPLWVMLMTVGWMGATLMLAFVPWFVFIADAFGVYAASANTGLIVTRCLMGTFMPLAAQPLIRRWGYGWGFMVLGGVSLVLAPVPVLVMRYGWKWRQRSRYTRDN